MKTNTKKDIAIIIGVIVVLAYLVVWAIPEARRQWRVSEQIDWSESDGDPYYNVPNFDY